MSDNPFEALVNAQMVEATKRKLEQSRARAEKKQAHIVQSDADAPYILGPQEQKLEDQSKQMRSYRAWRKAEYDTMAKHPIYFKHWNEFTHRVLELTPDNGDEFAAYIDEATWLHEAEPGIRRLALSFIANRLIRIRLEQGLAPFDDSLPFSDEEPTLFETIRTQLRVMT
jgi:hypothetical protein